MFKSRLKAMREIKGLSQSELSAKSGVTLRNIQAYEIGYRDINKASVESVLKLAEALGCDITDIINK